MATLGGGPLRIYRQGGRESSILAASPQHTGHLGTAAAMTTTVVEPTAAVETMFLTYANTSICIDIQAFRFQIKVVML